MKLLEIEIPPGLTRSSEIMVRFDHPDAAPSDLGTGQDDRMLALAFRRLRLHRCLDTPA